jgi:hypothetical protein
MGICHFFPKDLVFAPALYMGIGLKHLHTIQEISRIKDITLHTHSSTTTGALYRSSFKLSIIELGRGTDIHRLPTPYIELILTNSLVKSTIIFLQEHEIQLHHSIRYPYQQINDRSIMDVLVTGSITFEDLARLNRCRLYLQAFLLSDITTGDGLKVTDEAWNGKRNTQVNYDASWPRQGRPPRKDWEFWQKQLRKNILNRGARLRHPLGAWVQEVPSWQWYIDPVGDDLYSVMGGQWFQHSKAPGKGRIRIFHREGILSEKPSIFHPATTYTKGNKVVLSGHAPLQAPVQTPHSTLLEHLFHNSEDSHYFHHLVLEDDGTALRQAIQSFDAIAVSDGSYQESFGSAAWVLEGTTAKGQITGVVGTPGHGASQSSYRSELTGLYCIVLTVNKLCAHYGLTDGGIIVGCDRESALEQAFGQKDITLADPCYDLLLAIRHLLSLSPLQWQTTHIKGHQDDNTPVSLLDRWAKLNIEMESMAKKYLPLVHRQPRYFAIPSKPWSLWRHQSKLGTNLNEVLYNIVHATRAKIFWKKKGGVQDSTAGNIDWEAILKAGQEVPRSRQHFITKHFSGMCGVRKFMK